MSSKHKTLLTALLLIIAVALFLGATVVKWKPMTFDNPGTKRLIKSAAGNYFFYRSLPEKSLVLRVKDLPSLEIRAVSKAQGGNPEFILKYEDKRIDYKLKQKAVSVQYQVFEPVRITLPAGLTQAELICYDRDVYFRAFMPVQVQSKKPKVPALKIVKKSGDYEVSGPSARHLYYAFSDSDYFAYQVRQGMQHMLFVRAELTSREKPVFGLFENGKLVRKYELSIKRSNTYKAEGISHLTIGKKIDFPAVDATKTYELRALTKHRFLARPVIRKA